MKLATIENGSRDGELVAVSNDGSRYLKVECATTLQQAIERWQACAVGLQELNDRLEKGDVLRSESLQRLQLLPSHLVQAGVAEVVPDRTARSVSDK